jgi:hypothetical protein
VRRKREGVPQLLLDFTCFSVKYVLNPLFKKKSPDSWVLVIHTCNPSYSGDRDQEDIGQRGKIVHETLS